MPTYDYRCLECEVQFEKFQGINEPHLEECPECNGKVKRLIGAGAGLIFKGSGFYITDYRSEGYKESAKKDEKATSEKSNKDKKNKKEKQDKKSDTSSQAKSQPKESD
ncbi:zinc ribbon domain-containing protein [Candidatus Poribacteria bacterium]|nr:zinc ribbon domain-containing protein [Candidatus Poribacteria bacterium]MYB65601.1 zinc ribbon domain-containing protein [Candidatus Poribacteria bacterium]MYF54693.1 zinc ribbon domain-containing protein [Candidatus Poribacteria bacterium]